MTPSTDKYVRTKSDELAVDQKCYYDQSYPDKVRRFIETYCIQSVGRFQGLPLELLPWQLELIDQLYGWRSPSGGLRFLACSCWLPKANGKTTIGAALSLYHLLADNQKYANVVTMATDVQQATTAFKFAFDMIDQHPKLKNNKQIWPRDNIKTVQFGKSVYKVLSGERGGNKRGRPLTFLLYDEIASVRNRTVFDDQYANISKIPGLMLSISTAGHDREGVGYEWFKLSQDIISGKRIDTAVLPIVYAANPEDDWREIETFAKCNPSYPVTITQETVEKLIVQAKNEPRRQNVYQQQHLNIFTGSQTAWLSQTKWDACGEDIDESSLYGLDAIVSIDYAFRGDLCCYVLLVEKDQKIYLLARFFTPRKYALAKEQTDRVPYTSWASDPKNHLTLTNGDSIDYEQLRQSLYDDSQLFNFTEVAYDPTGLGETAQICEREYGWMMVPVPPKPSYTGQAACWFERAVIAGEPIRHTKNPIANWSIQNTGAKETPNGLYLFKGSGQTQRIDFTQASVMAISRYLVREVDQDGPWFITV